MNEDNMENKQKKLYVNGFYPKELQENTPSFIWGKGSFHIDKMIAFLEAHRPLAIGGYLNYEIKHGEKGRYAELDLYRFNQQPEQVKEDALINLRNPGYPTPTSQGIDLSKTLQPDVPEITPEMLDINPDDIPY